MLEVDLAYGSGSVAAAVPDSTTVLTPRYVPTLTNEAGAIKEALAHPRGTRPLADIVRGRGSVAVVTPDITRPLPTARILEALLPYLEEAGAGPERVTLINGTGSHRGNSPDELAAMYGRDVVRRYPIVNHDAARSESLTLVGKTQSGVDAWLNHDFVQADVKIVLGLIEPHFFAGFSGGAKGIYPGLTGLASILAFHNAQQIDHPRSTWGVIEGNPHQIECQSVWNLVHPDFLLNCTVNRDRGLTGIFAGSLEEAFPAGCAYCKDVAMTPVAPPEFDVVLTSNSGYPLDQNLYQTVKGLSAAAQIVRPGGTIVCAAECREGFPDHGEFHDLMLNADSPQALLEHIAQPGFQRADQWEAQTLAKILTRAEVWLYSTLPARAVSEAMLTPIASLAEGVATVLDQYHGQARIAVLPEGPMTIPYLSSRVG